MIHLRRLLLVLIVLLFCWAFYIATSASWHREVDQKKPPRVAKSGNTKSLISENNKGEEGANVEGVREQQHPDPSSSSSTSIHFITVQTNVSPGWCRNMDSARRTGISVTSLGWGQPYSHVIRPAWITSFLARRNLPLDDVVLFADGSDTMFTGVDAATILRRFEYVARTEYKGRRDFVMFNAEANCFHQQLFPRTSWGVMKGRCISVYKAFDPFIRTKWRYLNAGAWIGTVRAALRWFGNASRVISADKAGARYWWCDQSLMGGMMLAQTKAIKNRQNFVAVLDTKNSIFLPTYHLKVKDDVCTPSLHNKSLDDNDDEDHFDEMFHHPPKLVLCHSNRAPAVLHFNGKSGNSGIEAERRVDFSGRKEKRKNVQTIYTWDTRSSEVAAQNFEKLCPKFAVS